MTTIRKFSAPMIIIGIIETINRTKSQDQTIFYRFYHKICWTLLPYSCNSTTFKFIQFYKQTFKFKIFKGQFLYTFYHSKKKVKFPPKFKRTGSAYILVSFFIYLCFLYNSVIPSFTEPVFVSSKTIRYKETLHFYQNKILKIKETNMTFLIQSPFF